LLGRVNIWGWRDVTTSIAAPAFVQAVRSMASHSASKNWQEIAFLATQKLG
jgi:hypothetical protein